MLDSLAHPPVTVSPPVPTSRQRARLSPTTSEKGLALTPHASRITR